MVANPAPCLPACTGLAPEYKACWEEPPTTKKMVQVERLLKEITDLSAQGLMGAAVAISFSRQLTQPIQERVHPAFEYWGCQDPTRGQERKVPREEIEPGRPHHSVVDPGQGLPKSPLPEAAD